MKVIVRATKSFYPAGELVIKEGSVKEVTVIKGMFWTVTDDGTGAFGTCSIEGGWEVFEGTNQLAQEWWNSLTSGEKFYKTIAANSVIKGDKTRHPMDLSENEIMLVYKFHKQK